MCRRDLGEWHCNAHSNNMVAVAPSGRSSVAMYCLSSLHRPSIFIHTSFEQSTITKYKLQQ
jgi:hypothetical protein